MTFFSTFSGVGGFEQALSGHTCVGWSEIDPYASSVYRYHFPDHPEYGDITKIDAAALPDFDLLVGGFPCFTAGTLVLTYDGWRPIESLEVGTLVLTHKGRWRPVTAVMRKDADATVVVHGHGFPDIHTTPEHPFYVRKQGRIWNNDKRQYDRTFAEPEWVDAGQLSSEYRAGQVLPDVLPDDRSTDFWWVVGRYLADGWRTVSNGKGRVVICANKNERAYVRERIERVYATCGSDERTVTKFHITRREFYDFLEPFGTGANGKGLPGWVYHLPVECAEALLDGYLTGDGCRLTHGWRATTVSRSLALSIGLLAQRARGIVASIYEAEVPPTTVIEGRTVRQQKQYQIVVADHNRSAIVDGAYGWKRIVRTTAGPGAEVFNISVEEDESYVADGAIVHNCQSHSVAGKRLAFDDDRGQLFFDVLRILAAKKPEWFILENVAGLLSSDGGRALGTILGSLVDLGYGVAWRVLDSRFAGVPQRRRRIFLVGHLGDERAGDVLALTESLLGDSAEGAEERKDASSHAGSGPSLDASFVDFRHGELTGETAHTLQAKNQGGNSLNYAPGVLAPAVFNETGHERWTEEHVAGTVTAHASKDAHSLIMRDPSGTTPVCATGHVTHALRAEGADASEDGTGRGTPIIAFSSKDSGADAGDTSPTLRAMNHAESHLNGGGQVAVAVQTRGSNVAVSEEVFGTIGTNADRASGSAPMIAQAVHETGHGFWQSDDAAATVRPSPGGTHANLVAVSVAENQRAEVVTSDTTGAIKTGGGKPGQGYPAVMVQTARGNNDGAVTEDAPAVTKGFGDGNVSLATQATVRRLTPRECERLMSWPDDWTRYGGYDQATPSRLGLAMGEWNDGKVFELSDSRRYRMVGNGVVSAVVRQIVERIERAA